MDYEYQMPNWQNEGTEASADLKANGFKEGYKPPAGVFNWFWSLVTKAIAELQTKMKGRLPLDGSAPMTGELKFDGGLAGIDVYNHAISIAAYMDEEQYVGRSLLISNSNLQDLKSALKLIDQTSRSDMTGYYDIYGAHNKPRGSYIGDGSATKRTIQVGGIGSTLKISTANGMAVITGAGAICKKYSANTTYGLPAEECTFSNGVLTLATTDTVVNGSRELFYEVL